MEPELSITKIVSRGLETSARGSHWRRDKTQQVVLAIHRFGEQARLWSGAGSLPFQREILVGGTFSSASEITWLAGSVLIGW